MDSKVNVFLAIKELHNEQGKSKQMELGMVE